jgi:hypothetical protein
MCDYHIKECRGFVFSSLWNKKPRKNAPWCRVDYIVTIFFFHDQFKNDFPFFSEKFISRNNETDGNSRNSVCFAKNAKFCLTLFRKIGEQAKFHFVSFRETKKWEISFCIVSRKKSKRNSDWQYKRTLKIGSEKKFVLISRHLTWKETIYGPIKNTKQIINFEDAYSDDSKVCYPELCRSDINFLPNFRFTIKHEL